MDPGVRAAAWLVDPRGVVTYVNDEARALFGEGHALVEGKRCYDSLHGKDALGKPFCAGRCASRSAPAAEKVAPVLLQRADAEGRTVWFLAFFVPVTAPPEQGGELHVAHLAYPMNAYEIALGYWRGLVDAGPRRRAPASVLSPRELEILERLACGQDQKRIARELFVSYATVRNHVQHAIAKLEVHSMQEAVALYLLAGDQSQRGGA